MPVHRVILRVDFPVNYDIIDQPGTVLRVINEDRPKFWSKLSENQQQRLVSATFAEKAEGIARSLSVAPNYIVASIEETNGMATRRLEGHDAFSEIQRVLSELREKFKIDAFERAGLRLYYFSSLVASSERVRDAFASILGDVCMGPLRSTLGGATDVGLSFDGSHADKIYYHNRIGPHFPDDAKRYFEEVGDEFDPEKRYDFICDLDCYETKFELPKTKLIKWWLPISERADQYISTVEALLTRQLTE